MHWILAQLPSFLVTISGVYAYYIAGKHKRYAWALAFIQELGWVSYSVWLQQWGLLIGCGFYLAVFAYNWTTWKPQPLTVCSICAMLVHEDPLGILIKESEDSA